MRYVTTLSILMILTLRPGLAAQPVAELIEVKKIWDAAPHSAFTDLIRWSDTFVCAFREGRGHVSTDGRIRILTSADGDAWRSAAVIELSGYDLRDAGLSQTPDGRLMLVGGAARRERDDESAPTGTFAAFSGDAIEWTEPVIVSQPGRWLWRVTWHEGTAYGVSYATPDRRPYTALMISGDGIDFREQIPKLLGDGRPTEATLRFDPDGTLYCLQRRDGPPTTNSAMLGMSEPPYAQWQWHDLGTFLGGPNLMRVPTGHWIAAGRVRRDDRPRTELAHLDVEAVELISLLTLPSGGDTSYPGLAWHDGHLWVSYYSSHEGKASIYIAKLDLR